MQVDKLACERFWADYLNQLSLDHPHRSVAPDAFAFGGAGPLGQELAQLVLSNTKRATTSLPIEFTSLNEAFPVVGNVSIILDGGLRPVAIIERTSIESIPFALVSAEYAKIEGEGDGSLDYWRQAHTEYFSEVCNRLGGHFNQNTAVLCQTFRMVWPMSSPT